MTKGNESGKSCGHICSAKKKKTSTEIRRTRKKKAAVTSAAQNKYGNLENEHKKSEMVMRGEDGRLRLTIA
jgi:hypothetical protein